MPAASRRARVRRPEAGAACAPATPASQGRRCRSAAPQPGTMPGPHVSHPLWSRLRLRMVDRNRNGAAAFVIVESIDPWPCPIAQSDRLGTSRKAALLASLDERKAAAALAEKIGGPWTVGEQSRGPEQEHEARLVITGRRVARMFAARRGCVRQRGCTRKGM